MNTKIKAKPVAKTVKAKPPVEQKAERAPLPTYDADMVSYAGASSPVRAGKNLSPVVLDRVPNSYTPRDAAALKGIHAQFQRKPFARRNLDAGVLSRLIGHSYVEHVSGGLDTRDATFKVTDKAVSDRLSN